MDVIPKDPTQQNVILVVNAHVKEMSLMTNALLANQNTLNFLIVKVTLYRIHTLKIIHIIISNFVACGCNAEGSSSIECDKYGLCSCKSNVVGTKCTDCASGYYGFHNCTG